MIQLTKSDSKNNPLYDIDGLNCELRSAAIIIILTPFGLTGGSNASV
jgi:hypothetical protein